MMQAPSLEHVEGELRRVFGDRLGVVVLHGWHATAFISTNRYHRVTGAELLRAAILLDVGPECIEFWDMKTEGGGIELSIELDAPTPVEKPVPLPQARHLTPVPTEDPKRRR